MVKLNQEKQIIKKAVLGDKAGCEKINKILIKGFGTLLMLIAFFVLSAFTISACSPTPTPEPIATPTPTVIPTVTPTPTVIPTVTPTPTEVPVVTPTPTEGPTTTTTTTTTSSNPSGPSACTPSNITTIPLIIEAKRTDANAVFVSWGPYQGLNTFIVQYGFQKDNFQYNTKVTGFSTTINSLPSNQQIFVRIAATDNCVIGNYGPMASIKGIQTGMVLGLPSTGFGPQNKLLSIILPTSLVGILSLSLLLIKKKKII